MLTLADTDTALDAAITSLQDATQDAREDRSADVVITQDVVLSTPWAKDSHWSATIGYCQIDGSWVAAEILKEVQESTEELSAGTFTKQTRHPIRLDAPVVLHPVYIDKPWGQEVWFSGIEERGESTVSQGATQLPLSRYLALAPQRLVQRANPLLLKILDPNPTYASGCLYFETHDTKHEVYVVTDINKTAWPDGKGAIRLGMNQQKRSAYSDDDEFRRAFLNAVQAYEEVRRSIDEGTDPHSAQLHNEEHARRIEMESFTGLKSLDVGDVVQVDPHIPHSLQHGVQVFEFQTPTYERNIISFNQKVLTQDHWDSHHAISRMTLEGPGEPKVDLLVDEPELQIERIVDFADFEVQRITLTGSSFACEPSESYLMVAVLAGTLLVASEAGEVTLAANSDNLAALVPASAEQTRLMAPASQQTVLLLARPRPHAAGTIAASP